MAQSQTPSDSGEIINGDPRDDTTLPDEADGRAKTADEKLIAWVVERVDKWKVHRNANYMTGWDTYERLWRAIYSEAEKTRKSGRDNG